MLSRLYGVTSDKLESIELVDEQGKVINATAKNEYADYFWLARGGGAATQHYPGIITGLQFSDLPGIPRNNNTWTRVRIDYRYNPTVDNAVEMLLAWQRFQADQENLEDPLFFRITVVPNLFMLKKKKKNTKESWKPVLYLMVYFFGGDDLHEEFLERFLPKLKRMVDGGTMRDLERFDHLQMHRKVMGVKTDAELSSGNKGPDLNKKWKGLSAVASKPVSEEAFRFLAETIFLAEPFHRRYAVFKPLGGAIQKFGKTETAFWHRDACWWTLINHFFEAEDSVEAILVQSSRRYDTFVKLMGDSFGGMYGGYADHGNSSGRDLKLYYGGNAGRVMQIKRDRDPHNLFRNYLPNTMGNEPFRPGMMNSALSVN
jgi:hypothetical protein